MRSFASQGIPVSEQVALLKQPSFAMCAAQPFRNFPSICCFITCKTIKLWFSVLFTAHETWKVCFNQTAIFSEFRAPGSSHPPEDIYARIARPVAPTDASTTLDTNAN